MKQENNCCYLYTIMQYKIVRLNKDRFTVNENDKSDNNQKVD